MSKLAYDLENEKPLRENASAKKQSAGDGDWQVLHESGSSDFTVSREKKIEKKEVKK